MIKNIRNLNLTQIGWLYQYKNNKLISKHKCQYCLSEGMKSKLSSDSEEKISKIWLYPYEELRNTEQSYKNIDILDILLNLKKIDTLF